MDIIQMILISLLFGFVATTIYVYILDYVKKAKKNSRKNWIHSFTLDDGQYVYMSKKDFETGKKYKGDWEQFIHESLPQFYNIHAISTQSELDEEDED